MEMDDFSVTFLKVLRIKQIVGIVLFIVASIVIYVIIATDIPELYLIPSIFAAVVLPVFVLTVTIVRNAIIKHFERKDEEIS